MGSSIKAIDEERRRLDLTQRALCNQAQIAVSTYTRLKRGHTSGYEVTLTKLRNALVIVAQRQAAE